LNARIDQQEGLSLNPNHASTLPAQPAPQRFGSTLLVGSAVALAVCGAAAGWLLRGADAAATGSIAPAEAAIEMRADAPPSASPVAEQTAAAPAKPAPAARNAPKAPTRSRTAPAGSGPTAAAHGTPLQTQRAATCADCGVVEAVRPVVRKGEGSGVGAVAGGVVGAVVGNQVGGGNGRKAMTVLGAIGGGLAGNEIEKRAKSETVYEVQVRMDDGSLRTITQGTQPAPGSRVIVEGQSLRPASSGEPAPRMLRTSTGT
jgi:outer membrane lipoprotein SlyB